jgi:hypothetical protein
MQVKREELTQEIGPVYLTVREPTMERGRRPGGRPEPRRLRDSLALLLAGEPCRPRPLPALRCRQTCRSPWVPPTAPRGEEAVGAVGEKQGSCYMSKFRIGIELSS